MKSHHRTGKSENTKISRRQFIGGAAAATAAFTIVPRYVLGRSGYTAPSEKVNIAVVGTGGQGTQNIKIWKGLNTHSWNYFKKFF